jgi:ABC-type Fe3+/spermidine/putrescine transport system ATPase subunit
MDRKAKIMKSLQIEQISKKFSTIKALDSIDLTVNPGELMAIMGPSGCGKSTLLNLIVGSLTPDSGRIFIDGEDIDPIPIEQRKIGFVPQDFGLFPHLSVFENIAFSLRIKKIPINQIKAEVGHLLEMVNLIDLNNRKPQQLSGGQKQRVALARALAMNPNILLLDEPLSNIDESTKLEVRQNLKQIQRTTQVTTLCVTHTPDDAFDLGDRIAIMYAGKIIQCDAPQELLDNPVNDMVRRLIAPMYFLWNKM